MREICKLSVIAKKYGVIRSNIASILSRSDLKPVDDNYNWDKQAAIDYLDDYYITIKKPVGEGWIWAGDIAPKYSAMVYNRLNRFVRVYDIPIVRHGRIGSGFYYRIKDVEIIGQADKMMIVSVKEVADICKIPETEIIARCEKFNIDYQDGILCGNLSTVFKNKKRKKYGSSRVRTLKEIRENNIGKIVDTNSIKGTVLRSFNMSKFLFVPKNGIGVHDCQFACTPPENIENIIEITGGHISKIYKAIFYVTGFKLDKYPFKCYN